MTRAIALSKQSMRSGGGPFGAVVAKDNAIIGEGANAVVTTLDPTAHAEVVAIRNACRNLGAFDLSGCVIYTSCEPCPMCLGAIWWARIQTIYYGNTRMDAAQIGFDDNAIYQEVALPIQDRRLPLIQCLHEECIQIFEEWSALPGKTMY